MTDRKRLKNETGLGSALASRGAAMRRSGLADFSADSEEAESSLSDSLGLSQERGRLRGGAAFSLLASVDMVDATQRDGRRLGKGETDSWKFKHVGYQYFNSVEICTPHCAYDTGQGKSVLLPAYGKCKCKALYLNPCPAGYIPIGNLLVVFVPL
jgi:hypothetical protein